MIISIFFVIIMYLGIVSLYGYTVSWLWEWFLVPLGLPPIGFGYGMGIVILFILLNEYPDVGQLVNNHNNPTASVLMIIGRPLFSLFFGALIKYYII